jgi:cytochrome c6
LTIVACDSTPTEVPDGYVSRPGKEIYTDRCVVCHGPDGKLGASGAKDLTRSTMDSTEMVDVIKNGRNGMPRQARYFVTDQELANTIDYIISLRK